MTDSVPKPDISITVASYPFNQSSADISLRTPDGVDYYVHSHILSQAAPVFADMFTTPQPSRHIEDNLVQRPIVDVTEDSKTLDRLLRLCYPIPKHELGGLDDIVPVITAALKYEMDWPVSLLAGDLLAIAPQAPLKVWAIACRTRLEDVAHKAASEMRARGDNPEGRLQVLETLLREEGVHTLDGVCAGSYFRLCEFLRSGDGVPRTGLVGRPSIPPLSTTLLSGFMKGFVSASVQLKLLDSTPTGRSGSFPEPHSSKGHMKLHPHFKTPSDPSPDVWLRCNDGTRILAHRLVMFIHGFNLKYTSYHEEMTEVAPDETSDHSASKKRKKQRSPHFTADLELDGRTATSVLRVCYGGEDNMPSDLPGLASVLTAADRYALSQIRRAARRCWDKVATASPLAAYFIALRYGLNAHAKDVARKILEEPLAGAYVTCMEDAPSLAYHRLLMYYRECAEAVGGQLEKGLTDWQLGTRGIRTPSGTHRDSVIPDQLSWMSTHLLSLESQVESAGPGRAWEVTTYALFEESTRQPARVWPSCVQSACQTLAQNIMKIGSTLPQAISEAIAKVELEV